MTTTKETVLIEVTESGARVVKRSLDDISGSSKKANTELSTLKGTLANLGLALSIGQVISLADSYTTLLNRLKLVTSGTENLNRVSRDLFSISNRNLQSFQSTSALYAKFATATDHLGISQSRLLAVIESIGKAATISGSSAANQTAALEQLAQAVGSNNFAGDELKSVAENAPRVAKVIADAMGVPVGALKKLGAEGKINTQIIIEGFEKAAKTLEEEFSRVVPTVGIALTVLQNHLIKTFGDIDQGVGLTAALANGILALADNMGVLIRIVIAAGVALGISYAVKGVGAAIAATRALTLAIAANPLGAIVTGAVLAVSALAAFSDQIALAEDSAATLADVAVASFETLGEGLSNVVTAISDEFPSLKGVFEDTFGFFDLSLADMLRATGSGIDAVIGAFKGFGAALTTILRSPLNALILLFTETFNTILRAFTTWLNFIIGRINEVRSTLGLSVIETFKAAQIPLNKSSEEIGKAISDNIAKGIKEQNSAQKAVEEIIGKAETLAKNRAAKSALGGLNGGGVVVNSTGGVGSETKAIKDRENFLKALREEEAQIGKTEIAVKLLKAAELGVLKDAKPIIDSIEGKTKALEDQEEANRKLKQDLSQIQRITEATFTPQERLNAQIAEFDRLVALPNGKGLTIETYNRAVKEANEEFKKLKTTGKDAFGSIDQYAIQAARNIQTHLANFFFDPFEDGLEGMVKGVANAVRRMVAEFAAMKVAQGLGLNELFSGSLGGGGATGKLGSLINGGNLLSSIGSFVGRGATALGISGFGASGAASAGVFGAGGLPFLGGAGTALGSGSALGGAAAAEFGAIASAGAGLSAIAGPLAALAAGFLGGRAIAGDKKIAGIGGTEAALIGTALGGPVGAVVGGAILKLFGRGPFKFRHEAISGTATATGFDGEVTDIFRSKGGLLRGNKHREQTSPNEAAFLELFDTTIKTFGASVRGLATNIGADTTSLDNYKREITLVSATKERLTEEAVAALIDSIGQDLAGGILKQIDIIGKTGETNIQTLQRVNAEFNILNNVAIATGRSLRDARAAVENIPAAFRTLIVDQLGGVDDANAKISFFINTFLTDAEKAKPAFQALDEKMKALGFSANITRTEFKKLIQSVGEIGGISKDQAVGLLTLAQEFDAYKIIADKATEATGGLVDAETNLASLRSELVSKYQQERSELQSTLDRFTDFGRRIKDFRESLLLGELSPLTPAQKLEEARTQFNQTRSAAFAGDESAIQRLPDVAAEFLKASQTYNASSGAFISDFQLVQDVLQSGQVEIKKHTDWLKAQLDTMDTQVGELVDINENTRTMVDLMKELATGVLNSEGNSNITTQQIQDFVKANPNLTPQQLGSAAVKNGVSIKQLEDAGVDVRGINNLLSGATVTDKQIKDFIASGASPRQIYDAAQANGISFQRLSQVSGISLAEMENWARANNLPVLDRGTDFVSQSGMAFLHRGEAVAESTLGDKVEAVERQLIAMREDLNEQNNNVVRITAITNAKNAEEISRSNLEAVDRQEWKKRTGTRRK